MINLFKFGPLVLFVLTFVLFVLPLKLRVRTQAIWAMALLVAAVKFICFESFGGHAFSPELPQLLIWSWDFLYSGFIFLLLLSLPALLVPRRVRMFLAPLLAWSLAIWGLLNGIIPPTVREVEFSFANLPPSLDGYRIAQISDIHCSCASRRWRTESIVRSVNALKADLVCITGDFVDGTVATLGDDLAPLADLKARDGVLACTGNHEYYRDADAWLRFYRKRLSSVRFLDNACCVPASGLCVGGVPDVSGAHYRKAKRPDVKAAFAAAPKGCFRILLQHRPQGARENVRLANVRLQLSGHTHGGIAPILRTLVARHNGEFCRGAYDLGPGWLYVNPGTGQWAGFPIRFFNPSEITLITLRRKS